MLLTEWWRGLKFLKCFHHSEINPVGLWRIHSVSSKVAVSPSTPTTLTESLSSSCVWVVFVAAGMTCSTSFAKVLQHEEEVTSCSIELIQVYNFLGAFCSYPAACCFVVSKIIVCVSLSEGIVMKGSLIWECYYAWFYILCALQHIMLCWSLSVSCPAAGRKRENNVLRAIVHVVGVHHSSNN